MRVRRQATLGVLDADTLQHVQATLANLARVQIGVQLERFTHLPANGQRRVERDHGLLEHHADLRAAHLAHGTTIVAVEGHALELDAPAAHLHGGGQQADRRPCSHGLATAGLAHQGNDFSGCQGKAQVVNGQLALHPGADFQVLHG